MSITLRFGAKETKVFCPWKSAAVSLSCYINIVHQIPEDKDMGGRVEDVVKGMIGAFHMGRVG